MTELFLDNARYNLLVKCLRKALRRTYKHADERAYTAHTTLSLAGINMGRPSVVNGKVIPEFYGDLVEALAAVQPCAFSGEIENDEIITALGDAGNIWPAAIRADVEAHRQAVSRSGRLDAPAIE
ncbi:hypothetical protein NKJ10_00155 [Mesorhizobium sp. M0204]|uniref:hypothetical protein n=1 Tax=Mesorhizobium sp. M0204 TaxID=2956913 RepID=UPI0033351EB8